MNFLKELEKKSYPRGIGSTDSLGTRAAISAIDLADVKIIYKKSQRVFWNKRKKEIEKKLKGYKGLEATTGEIELNKELSWIEKQLKEVK